MSAHEGPFASGLTDLSDRDRERRVTDLVCATTAELLGWEAGSVDQDKPYQEYGYNSMAAVELSRLLSVATGLELPLTLLFDCPTPAAVAAHLLSSLGLRTEADAVADVDGPAAVADEPMAIVGMACRYPGGVTSPDALWELVDAGRDAVSAFPGDRGWDLPALFASDGPGTSVARAGGFLDDVAGFDADFFGVSPREAVAIDPQQRLLLETAWESVEYAGIDPTSLRGTATGVFVGVSTAEYAWLARSGPVSLEGYWGLGTAGSVASGRIAYKLGLEGPALTIDTACSSSLVALHLAGQSLRRGECSLALVGGVAVLATPTMFVEFSRQGGLAADGRCKSFSAAADGTGWAEGVGMVLVERLSDAERLGHLVLAVVRGSAVNQDGASNGLTAPNGPSQQRVIRAALADAGLRPSDVDVVEAHGTGTTLGDPIEAQAIIAAYGQRRDRPLWLGSLKSNIGHAQAAAGVGGIIKMVQAMRYSRLPATLHVDEPTPKVDWSAGSVSLLTSAVPWEPGDSPRRAAVSAFGIGGTNAHVVLEEPPAAVLPSVVDGPAAWPLSARSAAALRAQAAALRGLTDPSPVLVGHALAVSRARFPHRAVVMGESAQELLAGLASLAAGDLPANAVRGVAGRPGRLAVLFTGQGSQRAGAGRALARRYPVFAEALDAVCACLDPRLDVSLREVMFGESELLHQTRYTQAALFALEVALYRLVESWGVRPDFLMGHSIGELAAAHVAGVLSLPDACALVAARGTLMGNLPQGGAMAAVEATEAEVLPELAAGVSIAAINGPTSVVLSGVEARVLAIAASWKSRGRRTKRLRVSHAFHSPLIDPMLAEFARVAAGLHYAEPAIPIVSNVTGALAGPELRTPEYWVRHARDAVRFVDGVRALHEAGATAYLELGPNAALTTMARDCLPPGAALVSALRGHRPEPMSLVTAMAELHVRGLDPDWPAVLGVAPQVAPVPLPTYAFQRDHYWVPSSGAPVRPAEPAADSVSVSMSESAPKPGSLLDLVRTQAAAVLGHSDVDKIDPARSLLELGIDSIGGAELHRRLADAAGADLPPTLLIDHTTAAAVAAALGELGEPAAPAAAVVLGTLTQLVRQAHEQGALPDAVPVLANASRFRQAFTAADHVEAQSVLVSNGAAEPTLICVPSFLAGSGPHQFARFGTAFRRRRRIAALTLPGFGADPRLPASWAVAVEALASATKLAAMGGPVVLVGYSIGGVVAHAVAAELAGAGQPPDGVVLIDTFEPAAEDRAGTFGWAMGQIIDRDHEFVVINDANVLAMGAYLRIFDDWRLAEPPAPSLLLAADRPNAGRHAANWRMWQAADQVTEVPGDHFSVLEQDAATSARAVEDWLDR
ncbi:MAG: alpha/beta fold hydrolase [Actinophytocola sp.]|uniref:type I polyketide synthase n=1 Tax=Actinophytocola sp. TaxID=1872138 RepID=UPI0013226086|nr:alpha/beta fold hydrolase [Actinophytocola sp.]